MTDDETVLEPPPARYARARSLAGLWLIVRTDGRPLGTTVSAPATDYVHELRERHALAEAEAKRTRMRRWLAGIRTQAVAEPPPPVPFAGAAPQVPDPSAEEARQARCSAGLSQRDVADRLGVPRSSVSWAERPWSARRGHGPAASGLRRRIVDLCQTLPPAAPPPSPPRQRALSPATAAPPA